MPSNLLQLTLTVRTQTALHVGSHESPTAPTDSLFRRDSAGRLLLPGTGIAGALRAHLTRIAPAISDPSNSICIALRGGEPPVDEQQQPIACGCIVCHLMGDVNPVNVIREQSADRERLNGRASRLIVQDAVLPGDTQSQIRDGVGIDPETGTSARAAAAKFDFETVPAQVEFSIRLELEDANDIDRGLLALALDEWQQGRIRFGGGKSRGSGSLELLQIESLQYDLTDKSDLARYLMRNLQPEVPQPYPIAAPPLDRRAGYRAVPHSIQSWVTFEFELQASGFFLTNDPTQAIAQGIDQVSLPFLPGAGLRGAIRSQAERIGRTLANLWSASAEEFKFRCPASNTFVTLTQSGLQSSAARIHQSREAEVIRLQAENYDLAEQLFGSVDWGSRLAVDDAALIGSPVEKQLDFVAIDRFTGGAADGAKFDAKVLWQPRFACRLHLEAPQGWELGWLFYVLDDLRDERLTVGAGGSKGFGMATLENLRVTLGYTHPEAVPEYTYLAEPGTGQFFLTQSLDPAAPIILRWRQAFTETLNTYTVAIQHGDNSSDPYWDRLYGPQQEPLMKLYTKETNPDVLLNLR